MRPGDNASAQGQALAEILLAGFVQERQRREYEEAVAERADRWVPASHGLELPFTYHGTRWVWVFNPAQRRHGYLDLDRDQVVDDYESCPADRRQCPVCSPELHRP